MKKIISVLLSVLSLVTMLSACSKTVNVASRDLVSGSSNRVISFNLRFTGKGETSVKTRAPLMIAALNAYKPDSVGFQEATPQWMKKLKKGLTDYDYVGVGRDDGKNKGEYASIFYLKERYELVDSGNFWLSDTPDKPSIGWDAACIRICTWAVLKNKQTGDLYAHINTHLDHEGQKAMVNGAKMVLKKAEELGKKMPVIVTGDFNVGENSDAYNIMTSKLFDSKFVAPDTMSSGTYHDYNIDSIEDVSPIDYIFVNKGVTPVRYKVINEKIDNKFLSDHFGLVVDFNFNGDIA